MLKKLNYLYFVWATALAATTGSLAFSELAGIVPCNLCWYQRILMYPLVLLVPLGIIKRDLSLPLYVLVFSILGVIIALYQSLLQWGLLPETLTQCSAVASCATKYWSYGFLTIPFLSLLSFLAIAFFAVMQIRRKHE